MNFLQKLAAVWQKVSLVQRALLIAIVLTFCIVGGLLIRWARMPNMQLLYQDLVPEEASKIVDAISKNNVPYELRNGGTSIWVPEGQVYQVRLDMAKEGLPAGGQGGYKIFDNEKLIGVSPLVQGVNLKRALEEELAMSIQMIDGVDHARVHIVTARETLFASQGSDTSASVVLRLRPGYKVGGLNIAAITHLVAGSVEGLKSENVTVIDSQGRLLSSDSDQSVASGASTVADYKERVERMLAEKVEDMLTVVLGPGRATVRVSAVIDMNSTNFVTEKYEPKGVPRKEEITESSQVQGGGTDADGEPIAPGNTTKDNTIVSEFAIGKTVIQKVELPGKIKSLSVAAFVDLSPRDVNEASAESQAPIMQSKEVEEIIRTSLGLKETDSLKVVQAKFYRATELLADEEPSSWPRYMAIARQASLGIMAICALLVLKVFSGAKKKAGGGISAAQLAEGQRAGGLLPSGEGGESLMLRREIASTLQSNPDQARQLFASWLEEEGG